MLWLVGCAAALPALYLFLVAPNLRKRGYRKGLIPRVSYAHRGLHGEGIPENSLAAFQRAAEKGYGVELDLHLTRDGELAVMHDTCLARMCGVDQMITSLTMEEAAKLRLLGTNERIPAFREVLGALAPFQTPLIIELKSDGDGWKYLPPKVMEIMQGYGGFWCVESFDPRMMRWFKKRAPQVIRGQLAFDPAKIGEHRGEIGYALGASLIGNALSRPDFIAYGHLTDKNKSFRLVRRLFRPALAAWTVTSPEDFERLRKHYDLQIFEGFEPGFRNEK